MIHQRLRTYQAVGALTIAIDEHPDTDTISAFVEGRLVDDGSSYMVSHLVTCASCRHTTAQLIRLQSQAEAESDAVAPEESPGRLRQFLENLAAKVIPTEEDVVFAYQNPPESEVADAPETSRNADEKEDVE